MQLDHTRTLVVDFDDTLAFTHSRDWENATPNQPLIGKLNSLYDSGWNILIVTARGQLSCNGDHEAADRKYRVQIEKWLSDHGVKYTSLSFQKKLALYYIDDKAITPQDFIEKFEEKSLPGGLSGAKVVYNQHKNVVVKTASNTPQVVEWFSVAKHYKFDVPAIHTVIGDTIEMEYIDGKTLTSLRDVKHILDKFSKLPPVYSSASIKSLYIDRCFSRVMNDENVKTKDAILRKLEDNIHKTVETFSHGDFSCSNIIHRNSDSKIFMIDPILDEKLLSSYKIDEAKFLLSIDLLNNYEDRYFSDPLVEAHYIGHICRILPYAAKNSPSLYQNLLGRLNAVR